MKYIFTFFILISCSRKKISQTIPNAVNILIENCSNNNYIKKGDTLIITEIKPGDTINVLYKIPSSAGLDWQYNSNLPDTSIIRLISKQVTKQEISENVEMKFYSFSFFIAEKKAVILSFNLARVKQSKVYEECYISIK